MMNEYLQLALWLFALGYILAAAYQGCIKNDSHKSMKHEVSAILFLALLVARSVT